MPKTNESINSELNDFLEARGFEPHAFYSSGKSSPSPEDADLFQFQFRKDGIDYGTVTITIDGTNMLTVYVNNEIQNTPHVGEQGNQLGWLKFVKDLKNFASQQHQLKFRISNLDKLDTHMKKREFNKNKLNEGYYGTRTTSYTDNQPKTVKIVIKHNKHIDEGDQRFRYIEKIFLETSDGGRWPLNTKKPSEARVFARHLAEGGSYNDDRWTHISEICENIKKLGGFVRATRKHQFESDVGRMVNEATGHYNSLRETIKTLQNSRGYNKYFESWRPTLQECQDVESVDTYRDLFATSRIDPRIEAALPLLRSLNVVIVPMPEVDQFSSWADGVTSDALNFDDMSDSAYDGESDTEVYTIDEGLQPEINANVKEMVELLSNTDEMPVGPDAMNAINQLQDIIVNQSLYDELRQAARTDPDNDAKPIIISWLEKNRDEITNGRILSALEVNGVNTKQTSKTTTDSSLSEEQILGQILRLGGVKR